MKIKSVNNKLSCLGINYGYCTVDYALTFSTLKSLTDGIFIVLALKLLLSCSLRAVCGDASYDLLS